MFTGSLARINNILKSNINDLLDRLEDPEKMLRQFGRDLEEAVNSTTAALGSAVAHQRRLEREYEHNTGRTGEWQQQAEAALQAEDEAEARKALERKLVFERAAEGVRPALEESRETVARIRAELDEVRAKLKEVRSRQDGLIARRRANQARQVAAPSSRSAEAYDGYKRMAEKVQGEEKTLGSFEQQVEAAEVEAELHGEVEEEARQVERQIEHEVRQKQVDEELAALRSRLDKGN